MDDGGILIGDGDGDDEEQKNLCTYWQLTLTLKISLI